MKESLKERAYKLIQRLPNNKLAEVVDFIEYLSQKSQEEDRMWLDADLIETPQFEWKGGPPKGSPVKYVPGVGLIIEGDQSDARFNKESRCI